MATLKQEYKLMAIAEMEKKFTISDKEKQMLLRYANLSFLTKIAMAMGEKEKS